MFNFKHTSDTYLLFQLLYFNIMFLKHQDKNCSTTLQHHPNLDFLLGIKSLSEQEAGLVMQLLQQVLQQVRVEVGQVRQRLRHCLVSRAGEKLRQGLDPHM